jgi:phosphoribosylaminoimidazolecarboxamide formyltransferase/IMP cyclohydrolase
LINTMQIKRALISVFDKTGIDKFARELAALGYEIVSSGGTARHLREKGIDVIDVSDVTGFPEMLDGRVKTLHPRIHAGILACRHIPAHMEKLRQNDIAPIDLVAVNLYPFEQTVAKPGVTEEQAIENIDIGGPSLIRAAAKNYQAVAVLTSPEQYRPVLDEIKQNKEVSLETRKKLAVSAFELTGRYDLAINNHFSQPIAGGQELPAGINLSLDKAIGLRYGENPHQKAGFYIPSGAQIPFQQIHGKEISYNNILDLSAAWELIQEFKKPSCAIIKHTNPCGCATAGTLVQAYVLASQGELPPEPISRFGGIISFNRPLDTETALQIAAPGSFYEVIAAPDFDPGVKDIFAGRKGWGQNVRLVKMDKDAVRSGRLARSAAGGYLIQRPDDMVLDEKILQHVSGPAPTEDLMTDLTFAYRLVKHLKSNAIAIAKDQQLIGAGAGQMNRLASVRLALRQAGDRAIGSVLASDGFFPFHDNIEQAAAGGIVAIIQPGGSVKDADVIQKAQELNITMLLTGHRHFRH